MNTEDYKNQLKNRDRVMSAISEDGKFRVAVIKNTYAARTAQEKHELSPLPAFLLARQLAAASLIAVFLKGEERVILEADGTGPVQKIFAEAIQVGEVRGFALYNEETINQEYEQPINLFGEGNLRVTRVLYSKSEPVIGIVPLQTGDISSDLSYYFFQSEQIPSAVILDTKLDDKGNIETSAGLIIQAMPGAENEDLQTVYQSIAKVESINDILKENGDLSSLLSYILPFDFKVMKNDQIDFFCRCSKDSFMDRLTTFGLDEIKSMRDEHHNELVCQYCSSRYYMEDEDFENIITTIQAKQN